jgi:predicted GIY-YIG superfamily endonuclease
MTEPTALYRAYDSHGNLLYVGISSDAEMRIKQHECKSTWHSAVIAVKVTIYPDRKQASAAEIKAIKTEEPVWNVRPDRTLAYVNAFSYATEHLTSDESSWELFEERISHDLHIRRLMAAAVREAWHAYIDSRTPVSL